VGSAVWLVALTSVRAQAPSPPDAAEKSVAAEFPSAGSPVPASDQTPAQAADYVGEKECLSCHDAQAQGYVGSPHHRVADPRTPASKQGCETCHGPGRAHAADPVAARLRSFRTLAADEVNATCAACHSRGEHALWDGSQHESRGLACTSCHSVHDPKSPTGQLKATNQLAVCASCHRDKVAKIDRSGHMPVREGKMQCTTCHNVHGSTSVRLLRKGDSVADLCTSCHADKRGPFLWEHAPSRDGCATCHDPHGSSNERMLVSKPPILCQRCHVATRHPSTIYDAQAIGSSATASIRIYARSCVTCHSAIHGSNHPSGQRFVR
jgi:DmsE family decaheme c-type cytochrome